MRRLFKYVPILMSVLSSVFLFSVGFSSWLTVTVHSDKASGGSFAIYEVNEYVQCPNGPQVFSYTSLYFVDDDNSPFDANGNLNLDAENCGNISVTYFFTDKAKEAAKSTNGLTLKFSLWYTDAKDDAKIFKASNTTASVSTGESTYHPDSTTDNFSFKHTFTSTEENPLPDSVTVTYTLTTTVRNFRTDFGQYLLDNYGADSVGIGGRTTKFFTSAEEEVSAN
ncbi:MAG: hypothetical protein IJ459_01500 [Clostridia bacterium]|nr:hypothetical protein [Clostridia bacterium]